MKNLFKLLPFALLALGLTACDDDNDGPGYDVRVLTFEDADYKGADNGGKGFADWSSLIDDPQYGGQLLYPQDEDGTWIYNWNDEGNTGLASKLTDNWDDRQYWGGGHALSNYTDAELANGDYMHQLAIPAAGGHSGTNFCVHNGNYANPDMQPSIYFTDDKERVVESMWVINTAYALNVMKNGDYGTEAFGADNFLKIVATGFDAAGAKTADASFVLAEGDRFVTEWTRWDLSSLGKVAKIAFNIEGNQNNAYGLATPAYFAYDDVAVRFE